MAASGFKEIVYDDGAVVSFSSAAAIPAGTLVEVTGNMAVGVAGAASLKVVGFCKQGCTAAADKVSVKVRGYIVRLKAKGNVAAGDLVAGGSDGLGGMSTVVAVDNTNAGTVATGVTATRAIIGLALEAAADGAYGRVLVFG